MEVFSTITSPVFSELVVILRDSDIAHLHCEVPMFEALRKMNEVKPFKLVFLLEVLDSLQWRAQREMEEALDFLTTRGLVDFLDSPPVIRRTRFRQVRWSASGSAELD